MFELEYCDDPEKGKLKNSGITYEDTFAKEFENACVVLDNFIYLLDMFKIIQSCSEDLVSVDTMEEEYWKVNKALLNYVNAIYSFKELADGFVPPIKPITEKYYHMEKWYRFVCDFRNSVVHESVISTEFNKDDAFIKLDKLIDIQVHRKTTKVSQEDNRKRQIAYMEEMKKNALVHEGKHYYGVKKICREARVEITNMQNEVIEDAFVNSVMPTLKWLFNLLYKENDTYQYAFIVNKSANLVYEPNNALEDFYCRMAYANERDSFVNRRLKELFDERQYTHFLLRSLEYKKIVCCLK